MKPNLRTKLIQAEIKSQKDFKPSETYDGKVLLFLDFDGVLHAFKAGFTTNDLFVQNHHLEKILRDMTNVHVVVSSMWAKKRTLNELKSFFSEDVRHRFVGHVTKHTDNRFEDVRNYLSQRGESDAVWIAVDDLAVYTHTDPVVRTDHLVGLTTETANVLRLALSSPLEFQAWRNKRQSIL